MKKKNLAFTLAEVLIVIGIIGVVAALTLPNLNHATGDKETVTRLQKAYSILNEANDRAVAIYGPLSTWKNPYEFLWMERVGEFLKISKSCDDDNENNSCGIYNVGDFEYNRYIYQLPDGISFDMSGYCSEDCSCETANNLPDDICSEDIYIDINGPTKGKNIAGEDIFRFMLSDSVGILPYHDFDDNGTAVMACMGDKNAESCTWWVIEFGNLDYLKADWDGKCNDSNIILDGVNNTSCH